MKSTDRRLTLLTLALAIIAGLCLEPFSGNGPLAHADVVVFAAASTTNAMTEIGELYAAEKLGRMIPSFASSSTLAKQIGNGAPADVYLSANTKWMNYLEEKNLLTRGSRFDLLRNRIVFIAPMASTLPPMDIRPGFSPVTALGNDGRLALGDPDHVPAGMYGKKALKNLKSWKEIERRLAPMKDVRAALVLVERGEVPLGLVYATDAAISQKVRIVGTFPESCHPPIVYPVASVADGNNTEAQNFLDFLHTPMAQAVFKKYGFGIK